MTNDINGLVAFASHHEDPNCTYPAFDRHGRTVAERANPDYATALARIEAARQDKDQSEQELRAAIHRHDLALYRYAPLGRARDPAALLSHSEAHMESLRDDADAAKRRVKQVLADPTLQSLPTQRITVERDRWLTEREDGRRSDATARVLSGKRQFALSQDPHVQPETGHTYGFES